MLGVLPANKAKSNKVVLFMMIMFLMLRNYAYNDTAVYSVYFSS